MRRRKLAITARRWLLAFSTALLFLVACGGGGGGSETPINGSGNTQTLQVNLGPVNDYVNGVYTYVTICAPGSSNCQTIEHVLVDTGSEGLRLLSSQLTLQLPPSTLGGDVLHECVRFADLSHVWGPLATADVQIAGEKASSVPIQVISSSPSVPAPFDCGSGGIDKNTVAALGANGILGIGNFQQDCGAICAPGPNQPPSVYYLCPNSDCVATALPIADQVQNPVSLFPQDNNGVVISLPSIPDTGEAYLSGSLTFGIGTQQDNALGDATIYTTDARGDFVTDFNGAQYSYSYIDTGSSGIYFLSESILGIPDCRDYRGFYCPASTVNYSATLTGLNGASKAIPFSIANADVLFHTTDDAAFDDLGGSNPGGFAWGVPFFYGRKVFIGIENKAGPNGSAGPYWAYKPD